MQVLGQRQRPSPSLSLWGRAGESQGTHRLPAQSHGQSVFSKEEVVSPVLSSVQARIGEGLDPAFRSPQAERGATAKHFNCPTGSRPSALSTKSVPSLLRNHSFGLQDTPSSPSSNILPKPTLQCVKQMAGTWRLSPTPFSPRLQERPKRATAQGTILPNSRMTALPSHKILGDHLETPAPAHTHLLPHPVLLTSQGQGMLGVLALQMVHERISLAVSIRLLEPAERLQALGSNHRVPPLRGVHQPHIGEAPAPAAPAAPTPQGPVFPRVLGIVGRQHGGAAPLRICERGRGSKVTRMPCQGAAHLPQGSLWGRAGPD